MKPADEFYAVAKKNDPRSLGVFAKQKGMRFICYEGGGRAIGHGVVIDADKTGPVLWLAQPGRAWAEVDLNGGGVYTEGPDGKLVLTPWGGRQLATVRGVKA